jgi:hypothetical protein
MTCTNSVDTRGVMRGKGWYYDGAALEFGHEKPRYFARIMHEHLPPARECGLAAAQKRQK